MLIIATEVRPSKWGNGLYTLQFVPKGTIVWVMHKGFDLEKTREEIAQLSEHARACMETYTFKSRRTNKYVLCVDNAKYFNHVSENPNVTSIYSLTDKQRAQLTEEQWKLVDMDEGFSVAARDIQVGEELFTNYEEDGNIDAHAGSAFLLEGKEKKQ